MKSFGRKKSIQAGVASLVAAVACTMLSNRGIMADSTTASTSGIQSLGTFTLLSYFFLACSVVFFFYTLLKKD